MKFHTILYTYLQCNKSPDTSVRREREKKRKVFSGVFDVIPFVVVPGATQQRRYENIRENIASFRFFGRPSTPDPHALCAWIIFLSLLSFTNFRLANRTAAGEGIGNGDSDR